MIRPWARSWSWTSADLTSRSPRDGRKRATEGRLRPRPDRRPDDRRRARARGWLVVGCRLGRHPQPGERRAGAVGSRQPRRRLGWGRLRSGLREADQVVNDAAMQALGSYEGGRMLFLGLGTGLGSALVADGFVQPMDLGHLHYRKATFEDYVGEAGLRRRGKKRWRSDVADVVGNLAAALQPDYVVLGGGQREEAARASTEHPPRQQPRRLRRRLSPVGHGRPRSHRRLSRASRYEQFSDAT